MKRIFAFLCALCCFGAPAHSQAAVVLYGIIDNGLQYVSNKGGGRAFQFNSGWMSGSRWGLQGDEELGAGVRAIFQLEDGFNGGNGLIQQPGRLFGRQAFMGISLPEIGTVTFGRQYSPVVDFVEFQYLVAQPLEGSSACHLADMDGLCNGERINNSIKFKSIEYGGFTFGGLYSFGGNAGSFSRDSIWGVGATLKRSEMVIGVAYLHVNSPNTSLYNDNLIISSPVTINGFAVYPAISGYASARTQEVIAIGMSYQIGNVSIGGTYSNTRFGDLGTYPAAGVPSISGTAIFSAYEVRSSYRFSPALSAGVSFLYTNGSSVDGRAGQRYREYGIGAVYSFSKSTDVYINAGYQTANGIDSTGKAAMASLPFLMASKSDRQFTSQIGMRHRF
ncbi:porin [Burkholderia cepacia]|uniref:porin n=1 Tax=Burkholderia cepacia TaxID=292 RepID=UPI002AB76D38|nr:porin [Burkholderia cepacia]